MREKEHQQTSQYGLTASSARAHTSQPKRRRLSQPVSSSLQKRRSISRIRSGSVLEDDGEREQLSTSEGEALGDALGRHRPPPRSPSFYSSTAYAAGSSGRNGRGESGSTSSSDASSSDRHVFDWDAKRAAVRERTRERQRMSFDERQSSARARRLNLTLPSRYAPGEGEETVTGLASVISRGRDATPPYGTPASADAANAASSSTARRQAARPKRRLSVNPVIETALIVGAGAAMCHELGTTGIPRVQSHVTELAWICSSTLLYLAMRGAGACGFIWSTDHRNYRQCGDDGALSGLLMGPLLAAAALLAAIRETAGLANAPNGSPLPYPNWQIEGPLSLVQHARPTPDSLHQLVLSRCSLVSLQTLTSTILLLHLLGTRWIRRPADFPQSNWRRLGSFVVFEILVTGFVELVRELAARSGISFWTDLARWEVFTAALFYQSNLYCISRLARKSFTLGELSIVAAIGVTLVMETLALTVAKVMPFATPFVKAFRSPTPLVVFQSALVVGSFMIGFLLSPLLYLSRHLAQKPVHRLRWPHKRDLHRRLLAGFFYLFAALYIVGVLGLWTRWILGRRDPWVWVLHFLIKGKHPWSRPLLVAYWLALVAASVLSWQAIVVSAKRFRVVRNPTVTSVTATAATATATASGSLHENAASAAHNADVPIAPSSANTRATAAGVVRSLGGLGAIGNAAANTETGGVTLKRAATLSLNARRKFFHALAVMLFVPGIAADPAFMHLAFSLAFSAFIFAEYIRYYALYPFGATLHVFLAEFTDHKDSGPVILSHFYLLTGCAGPLWIEGSSQITQQIGVLVLGVGDALASIVGRRYGRVYWPGSSKTVEGSVAFVGSILCSTLLLRMLGWVQPFSIPRLGVVLALLGALEGTSSQNDNLILPVYGFVTLTLLNV
ncbi:dolichol kinase [Ceraceosorus bombacis]|uniref:dolichol kinase n=1 Tax=Ceraceosorus bombacis TaxID=401625 RepID=A0A0P1BD76_9BASI|nr:dolichol kinase [Ceraceosorus bombacis]